MKAAHIAVLVELYDGHSVPAGQSQIGYGATFVKTHFAESSMLFGVDQIIKAVLRSLFGTINFFTAFLPIPALQSLIRLAEAFVRMSLTYVDEIILAYLIRTRTQNPWSTARDGLILFAQNYTHFLKNAAWLSVMMWALTFVIFVVFLAPAAAFVTLVHSDSAIWAFAFAVVFAIAVKKAIMEPIAIAALMQVYFREIEGQTPNAEWTARLEQVSCKFRDLATESLGLVVGADAAENRHERQDPRRHRHRGRRFHPCRRTLYPVQGRRCRGKLVEPADARCAFWRSLSPS